MIATEIASVFIGFLLISHCFGSPSPPPDACLERECPPLTGEGPSSLDAEKFTKLKLNARELYGSRWAIEQKEVISVSHAVDITDASLIHDNQLSLHIEFNLRQSWSAPGLEFPPGLFNESDSPGTFVSATDKVLAHMWSPESYISTARASQMNTVGTPLSLVYIFKNRTIIFKVRMFTNVGCTTNFQWYPVDVQTCDLVIESYKYQDNIVRYQWTDEKLYRPVVINIGRLFQYELRYPVVPDNGTLKRGGRSVQYPFVRIRFTFERKLGNNLIQVYTPTVLVVVLSFFSFWLGLDAIPGRISLLVTCMLTLVTMHSGIKSSIPPVHYITMMDLWMVYCMASVFLAMCEFIVIKCLHLRYQNGEKKSEGGTKDFNGDTFRQLVKAILSKAKGGMEPPTFPNSDKSTLASVEMLSSILVESSHADVPAPPKEGKPTVALWVILDKISRLLFPSAFIIFNLVYWPVLLHAGSKEEGNED